MIKKILMIDDERDFTELAATLLRFHNFEVDAYNESLNVDKHLMAKQYDLIVTDLMMPDVDGFKVIENIRAIPNYAKVPVIVLSAKVLTDAERKFLMQQEAHFVMKPFEPQELVDKIRLLAVN